MMCVCVCVIFLPAQHVRTNLIGFFNAIYALFVALRAHLKGSSNMSASAGGWLAGKIEYDLRGRRDRWLKKTNPVGTFVDPLDRLDIERVFAQQSSK